jgi:hypothetical protein
MKHAKKTSRMIFAVLQMGIIIAVSNWAFAQAGSISGSVKDSSDHQGVANVIITARDTDTGTLAGTGITDASGNYSVNIPSLGNYSLVASKPGYNDMSVPDVIELSDATLHRTINISIDREALLKFEPEVQTSALTWETRTGRSYLIPALEIPAFILLLNGVDRLIYPNDLSNGKKTYSTNLETFKDHVVDGPWGIDTDAFEVNQFLHPYQGSMYHGFARSAGLNYWESLAYSSAGSFLWETGGETSNPSINDQIASGIGGTFFGEALFRMANLMLERDDESTPGFWRELLAMLISPPTGINRNAFGDRFKSIYPSHDPATFWRLQLGASRNTHLNDNGTPSDINRNQATANFIMAYGLPGKHDYSYERPFDYFHFEFTTRGRRDPFDNVMIRGLLLGTDYDAGDSYSGIWGLYGGYDYISPDIFRVSSTSVSLGTTYQWKLLPAIAVQGSTLGGVGYAASGNVTQVGERDYHFGVAPQGLLALRLILADRAMLDLTGRAYYLSGVGGDDPGGAETIYRLNSGFTVRILGHHAIGIQLIASDRDAEYPDRADSHQTEVTVSLVYTWLGDVGFGIVE